MDPLIIDQTPKGSAILAYGAARGPRWNIRLLAFIAGSLALVGVITCVIWFWTGSVELPANQLGSALLIPRRLDALDPALRLELPAPWRAAAETHSHFPAVFGLTMGADRRMHAFALIMRTATVVSSDGLGVRPEGAFLLLTDGTPLETAPLPISHALGDIWNLRHHAATFRLRAQALETLTNDLSVANEGSSDDIRGTWDGLVGRLNLPSEDMSSPLSLSAPIFAVLGDRAEDARPAADALLSQGIDLRAISQTPQLVALDPANDGSLALSWAAPLSPSDTPIVAAARNSIERRAYMLPDESEGLELFPVSSSGTSSGPSVMFVGAHLASSTLVLTPSPADRPKSCPGILRFSLNGAAFKAVLSSWMVSDAWKQHIEGMYITSSDQGPLICINIINIENQK